MCLYISHFRNPSPHILICRTVINFQLENKTKSTPDSNMGYATLATPSSVAGVPVSFDEIKIMNVLCPKSYYFQKEMCWT